MKQSSRKILGLLLALLLVVGLLPLGIVAAYAEGPVSLSLTIHTLDEDQQSISEVGGTASLSKTEAELGEEITVSASPFEGFKLFRIAYGEVMIYVDGDESSTKVFTVDTNSSGDPIDYVTVVFIREASAPAVYTVHFNPNGGSGEMADVALTDPDQAAAWVLPACGFAPPEGQEFDYWDCAGSPYYPGDPYPIPLAGVTFMAMWKGASGTVYPLWLGDKQVTDANKADILGDGSASFNPSTNTLTLNDPTVSGLHEGSSLFCQGLDLTIEGSAEFQDDAADTGIAVKEGSLTVKGEIKAAGAHWGVSVDKELKLEEGRLEADGDTLAISAGEGVSYPDSHAVTDPENGSVSKQGEVYTVVDEGGSAAIHAVIEEKPGQTYTVTFNGNGGEPAVQTLTTGTDGLLDADELNGVSEALKYVGYQLAGWSLAQGGKTFAIGEYVFTGDTPVYAVWEPFYVTVDFDSVGGSSIPSQTVQQGQTISEPDDPVRNGYSFEGWFSDPELNTPFQFSTAVMEDMTLYAKWDPVVKYTVVSGGGAIYGKTSGNTLVIVVKRTPRDADCFKHFTGVAIDGGMLVPETDYTAKSGSTIITLQPEYLKTLNSGSHIVTIQFDDGKATTGLTVKAGAGGGARRGGGTGPDTGESGGLMLWSGLFLGSGLCLGSLIYGRRKLRRSGKL